MPQEPSKYLATVAISIDERQLAEAEARLGAIPQGMPKAIMRAINRGGRVAKRKSLQAISKTMNVKQSDLDGTHRFGGVGLWLARPDYLQAKVTITGRRVPVFRFGVSPATNQPPTQGGVRFKIFGGGGTRTVGNAFIAKMRSGHMGAFKRRPGARHTLITAMSGKHVGKKIRSGGPIQELFGPSIPHVAEHHPELQKALEVDVDAVVAKQFAHEVEFLLNGEQGRETGGEA